MSNDAGRPLVFWCRLPNREAVVDVRSGDEMDLLDESIRTVAGALLVTIMYALTGIVYAVVASPDAAGVYLFLILTISLIIRPVKGVTRTLQKRGSEADTDTRGYFGLTVIVAAGWIGFVATILLIFTDTVASFTPITAALVVPTILLITVRLYRSSVGALLKAVGSPSLSTWESSIELSARLGIMLLFADQITTAIDLITIAIGVQLVTGTGMYLAVRMIPRIPSREEVKRAASFAKWSIPDQFVDQLSYTMPVYVLGVVATPAAVAVYEAADRFADVGATIAFFLASPLLTKVSGDWSAGDKKLEYLEAAVTGGTGATFLVLAYILAGSQTLATLAFPRSIEAFRITIILVGSINVLRGGWTLLAFALEGIDRPAASLRTKVYGLIIAVPITAVLGARIGALAGGIGYIIMNLVVMAFVLWYTYQSFGRIPVDWPLAGRLTLSGGITFLVIELSIFVVSMVTGSLVAQAAVSAITGVVTYLVTMALISTRARNVFKRAIELYTPSTDDQAETEDDN